MLLSFPLFRQLVLAPLLPVAPAPRKPLVLLVSLWLLSCPAFAQEPAAPATPTVYSYVEQMPTYRHGRSAALAQFVERNRKFAREQWKTQGQVFVRFIVTDTGAVRGAEVVKGLNPTLDAEALRVIHLLDGQFLPGHQNGWAVPVYYTLAVPFVTK
ncbi:energy transducer TonB [Hymenobacter sediminicola]|uniref:Energy transducer TonB n=1 Tax=Hymenobacter sediminicola TaxID=2761579 RepID=A0A7G7W815_9BACT|nr:energy transducer TonB [Hymenobacter sediminicola]QNH62508.1 energy transducer TonB [Hymenobacter sediminicola]